MLFGLTQKHVLIQTLYLIQQFQQFLKILALRSEDSALNLNMADDERVSMFMIGKLIETNWRRRGILHTALNYALQKGE